MPFLCKDRQGSGHLCKTLLPMHLKLHLIASTGNADCSSYGLSLKQALPSKGKQYQSGKNPCSVSRPLCAQGCASLAWLHVILTDVHSQTALNHIATLLTASFKLSTVSNFYCPLGGFSRTTLMKH
ncbi:unnamed protein product [Symbiodinium natans]|uniref:Uncharacterized protein n=1 Tax=Symbiodinium natans TaxID=878477 RepID=A0A812I1U8_9DINO|nr:unnamed protein product [Symbiodinium natans]